jgi:hypothetical protein
MSDEAIKLLSQSQNPDGGWGAVAGRQSNTESSALALMALRSIKNSQDNRDLRRAEEWLINSQNADGSWPYGAGAKAASWSTALAQRFGCRRRTVGQSRELDCCAGGEQARNIGETDCGAIFPKKSSSFE